MKQGRSTIKTEPQKTVGKRLLLWILPAVAVVMIGVVCRFVIPPRIVISAALDECLTSTLLAAHRSGHTEGKYPAVTYTALGVQEKKDTTTVYGVMMYTEYTRTTQGELLGWGSDHTAFAMTAKRGEDGTYTAVDCWWPKDGAAFASSVKERFPLRCRGKATQIYRFYSDHNAACLRQAGKEIHTEDEYTVLMSERENVQIAYQAQGESCYIVAGGAFEADGTYRFIDDHAAEFVFGNSVVYLDRDSNDFSFNAELSKDIPDNWKMWKGTDFLTEDTRFSFVVRPEGSTASVGLTHTLESMNWMSKEALIQMFGTVHESFSFETEKVFYLPVKTLDSRAQLDTLLADLAEDAQWYVEQDEFSQFDESFFEKNALVMTYFKGSTASLEPKVADYVYTEEGTCLSIRLEVYKPEMFNCALGQWLLFSGIKRTDLKGVATREAYVENTVSDEDASHDTDLTFVGKVTEIEGTAVLMECQDVPQFSSGVWVELGNLSITPVVGETYVVAYEDIVMPSLPPRITAVSIIPKI